MEEAREKVIIKKKRELERDKRTSEAHRGLTTILRSKLSSISKFKT